MNWYERKTRVLITSTHTEAKGGIAVFHRLLFEHPTQNSFDVIIFPVAGYLEKKRHLQPGLRLEKDRKRPQRDQRQCASGMDAFVRRNMDEDVLRIGRE